MISYRSADLINKINRKPMIWLFNDNRAEKKFYNKTRDMLLDAHDNEIDTPINMSIYHRDNYVIVCDIDLFEEHFDKNPVFRQSECVGDIVGINSHTGNVQVRNNEPSEGVYEIDPLDYITTLSPDQNRIYIKYEPVNP